MTGAPRARSFPQVWSPGPIYRHGYYLGTDPDPRVRAEIVRDKFSGQ
jgi:hypothetical protein